MDKKIFIGSTRQGKYGIKIGFKEQDLETLREHLDDRGWVNIEVKRSREGNWYTQIDTYKPKENGDAF